MNEILKILRRQLNLTQKEFAEKISTTRGSIAQIEAGNNNLSFELSHRINKVFGVDLDDIVLKDGYLYSKENNELLFLKTPVYPQVSIDSDSISDNDLAILNKEYGWFPDIDTIKFLLLLSDVQLKNKLSIAQHEVRERLTVNNKICSIAEMLHLTKEKYYSHRFTKISEKDYIKRVISGYEPASTIFDNVKLKWITQIHLFETSNEDLTFQANIMLDYLKRGIEQNLSIGLFDINQELLKKITDVD